MKNKLAMFAGAYVFATITAGVYMYKKMTELKQQRDNQFNALELLSKNYEEKHQQLLKECDEQKKQFKYAINVLKAENSRLYEVNENLTQDIGDVQLALQSNDVELKSLRARLADYEHPDELAVKL